MESNRYRDITFMRNIEVLRGQSKYEQANLKSARKQIGGFLQKENKF